jgi:hypothetical protein
MRRGCSSVLITVKHWNYLVLAPTYIAGQHCTQKLRSPNHTRRGTTEETVRIHRPDLSFTKGTKTCSHRMVKKHAGGGNVLLEVPPTASDHHMIGVTLDDVLPGDTPRISPFRSTDVDTPSDLHLLGYPVTCTPRRIHPLQHEDSRLLGAILRWAEDTPPTCFRSSIGRLTHSLNVCLHSGIALRLQREDRSLTGPINRKKLEARRHGLFGHGADTADPLGDDEVWTKGSQQLAIDSVNGTVLHVGSLHSIVDLGGTQARVQNTAGQDG